MNADNASVVTREHALQCALKVPPVSPPYRPNYAKVASRPLRSPARGLRPGVCHWQANRSGRETVVILQELRAALLDQALIFIVVGLWVTYLVSSNLTRPLLQIIKVLREVREGRFDEKVRVTSNGEIGYTGDLINEMSEGLRERDFIKDIFGKYVTQEIRDEILAGKVSLEGELKEVTVRRSSSAAISRRE